MPLPAEQLDLGPITHDLRERVQEIDEQLVAGLDRLGDTTSATGEPLLGEEFLTACRRFVAQVGAQGPDVGGRRR